MEQHQSPNPTAGRFDEHHYTVRELASLWRLSEKTIRHLFQSEVGVKHSSQQKRTHRSFSIPESVANRMYNRLQDGGSPSCSRQWAKVIPLAPNSSWEKWIGTEEPELPWPWDMEADNEVAREK